MTKCSYCNKEIILSPSAAERSKKTGLPVSYYNNLFTIHAECQVKQRNDEVYDLMRRKNKEYRERQSKIYRVPMPQK